MPSPVVSTEYSRTSPSALLRDVSAAAFAVGSVFQVKNASDHIPIVGRWAAPLKATPEMKFVPSWLAGHDEFHKAVTRLADAFHFPACPTSAIECAKDAFYGAARVAKVAIAKRPARSTAEKLHWATIVIRASRSGAFDTVIRARAASAELCAWVSEGGKFVDTDAVAKRVAELNNVTIEQMIEEAARIQDEKE